MNASSMRHTLLHAPCASGMLLGMSDNDVVKVIEEVIRLMTYSKTRGKMARNNVIVQPSTGE